MIQVAVCDDDEIIGEELTEILSGMERDIQEKLEIEQYTSSVELCQALEAGTQYQILFLDIAMPDMDGVAVGNTIRNKLEDNMMQIIYISSQTSYAMQLFKVRPTDFIVKPFQLSQIKQAFCKACELICANKQIFTAKLKKGQILRMPIGKILYFCSTGRKIILYHTKGTYEFYGNIKELGEQLKEYQFIFIHRSYLVNFNQVERINYSEVMLADGTVLEISQSKRKQVKEFRAQCEGLSGF